MAAAEGNMVLQYRAAALTLSLPSISPQQSQSSLPLACGKLDFYVFPCMVGISAIYISHGK